jgi:hypothetical protein
MNLNRSQKLTVGVVALVLLVAVPLLWPRKDSRRGLVPSPSAPAAGAAGARADGTKAAALPSSTNLLIARIDATYVQERWRGWVTNSVRDPFRLNQPVARPVAPAISPARHLKLLATWLQTGGELAVIDQRIVRVGDVVAGLSVLRIEAGKVHLQGPEKTEVIDFNSYVPPPPPGSTQSLTNLIDRLLGPEREALHN